MNTTELRARIIDLHQTHTAVQIARLSNCQTQRVRNIAARSGIKCQPAQRYIEQHHARIVELAKTKTPMQMASELGISREKIYSYTQKHGIRCVPMFRGRESYKSNCAKAIEAGPNEMDLTLNIIRRHFSPVYAENTPARKGPGINLTDRYIIGDRLIVNGYEAVQAMAAAL